jgi:hypothetical protein
VRLSRALLPALVATLLPIASAGAQGAAKELPTVKLRVPSQARPPAVRTLVELRDCSTRPTVTITARWRRAGGRAVLAVSGIERVLRRSPRPATRRTDRIIYHRVPRGQPLRAQLITTWREAERGASSCKVHLPRLVGTGQGASAAARGRVMLRTPLPVSTPAESPQRGTGLDHVWTCGGARRGDFDCGQTVAVGSQQTEGDTEDEDAEEAGENNEDDDEDGGMDTAESIVLAAIAALGAAGIGAAAVTGTKKEAGQTPDSWEDILREEFAEPEEAVGARAGFITKVGAPTAALLTSLAAGVGGLTADAPAGHRVIAVAIVVAVSVGGVLYAFAVDYRARAAVAVARYESLAKLVATEAETAKPAKPPEEPPPADSGTPPKPSAPTTVIPLQEIHARYAGSPATLYAVESSGTDVVRYLLRDADGTMRWVTASEVTAIGGGGTPES